MSATYEHLTCAETAKLVRVALKETWPGVKFSVRSDTYAGGASIRVGWTDGPTEGDVGKVTGLYNGATFDGMIDLKSYHSSILVGPDGPREVHFGADFVFCDRDRTAGWDAKLGQEIAEFEGDGEPFDPNKNYDQSTFKWDGGGIALARGNAKSWGESGYTLQHQLAAFRSRYKPCDHSTGTYPAGAGVHRCAGCGMRCSTAKEATTAT